VDTFKTIGDVALGLGIFLGAVAQILNWWSARKNAKAIRELTDNTNSIKDALVLATGQAEHAKGVIAGRQEAARENRSLP
jgi:hypothetical protein